MTAVLLPIRGYKSMEKEIVLSRIKTVGVVAVIRAQEEEAAIKVTEACIEGGVAAVELTFTVPYAHRVIEALAKRYGEEEILLGAGTVLDAETARIAILSGATYVVSPAFDAETTKLCNRYRIPSMPGVMTPGEVIAAMEAGVDIVKAFPGELFGPKWIRALKGPFPQAQIMPTGGIDLENVSEWIRAGAVAVGVGSSLTRGSHADIVQRAKQFTQIIQETRQSLT